MPKQVDKTHYEFRKYVSKRRWASMWHQLDEILSLEPESVLEIGPGPGVLKALAALFQTKIDTLDLDPELEPDYVSPADDMPFPDDGYDVVCAFQMLEHVPYETALVIFREMARVAGKYIVISLPDARPAWPYSAHIPKKGDVKFYILRPWTGPREHVFKGEHHWEINKKGYSIEKVCSDLENAAAGRLLKSYRVKECPYHRFLIFSTTVGVAETSHDRT